MIIGVFGMRAASHFGGAPMSYEDFPYAGTATEALVLHIHREAIHHGAEIALLRDLYRTKITRSGT